MSDEGTPPCNLVKVHCGDGICINVTVLHVTKAFLIDKANTIQACQEKIYYVPIFLFYIPG